ncbi:MAG TPA: DUF4232 domain-containing protein [Acidimicrobiales bacterium]|jgi:hypothetical protein|nr:DUF4232 domain-containing protein [Acidimicrobiales bacterium]
MRRQSSHHRASLRARFVGWTGAFALTVGLLVWGVPATTTVASATTERACTTSNLVVWLNTVGNGAAGSSYYDLNFTNLSAHACTLIGYPGVSGVSLFNQQVGSSAARDSTVAPSVITLTSAISARGLLSATTHNTATVILQITEVGNFPTSMCRQISAAGLRVYPPGQTTSKVVAFPFAACAKGGPRYLHVEAVQKDVVLN